VTTRFVRCRCHGVCVDRDALPSVGIACLVAAVLVFVAMLGGARDFTHIDEHRYAEVSRIVGTSGSDWLVPPSQLGAVVALLATFGIARRLMGMHAALASLVVLASASRFAGFAGCANLDALVTGFVALSIYASVRGDAADGSRARSTWYASAALAAGLGVLVKGPIAIAIPAVAIAVQRLLEGRRLSLPGTVAAIALALLPAALWLAAAGERAGAGYVETIVMRHAIEHSLGRVNHAGGVWDYLRTFPPAFLPGFLLLPAAFAHLHWRRPFPRHVALALAWFVGGFVLLSLFPAKRHHYLMPLYPGAALLIAGLFAGGTLPQRAGRSPDGVLGSAGRLAIAVTGAALGLLGLIAVLLIAAGVDPTGA
jgi:4-amino-4-deoxy-L-arabinose transferase-like glycosyltransferase